MDRPDRALREQIVRYCEDKPSAQHNGIACVNRIWNAAWKGMKREVVTIFFMGLRQYLLSNTRLHVDNLILSLDDLEDVA